MSTGIRAGLSALEITPPPGLPMAGFAARSGAAEGVHDPLYVRALVVSGDEPDDAETALIVADLLRLTPGDAMAIRERVARQTGIASGAVMLATTHTHGGPETDDRRPGTAAVRDYVEHVSDIVVRAVTDAAGNRVAARMTLNFGREETVGKNRRRPGGVTDPAVSTIRIEATSGDVIGIVCGYACHPVTLGPDNRQITADYPGAVVRALEGVYPGAVAMFLTGCAGQINTGHAAEASLSTQSSVVRTFSEMSRLGRALAGAAVQAGERATGPRGTPLAVAPRATAGPQVRAATVDVAAPRLPVDDPARFRAMAADWRAESQSGDADGRPEDRDRLRRWADWADRMAASSPHDEAMTLDVTALRWGSIRMVGLPGEPFVEFGLDIRQRAGADVFVVGYANGCPGYVPHRSAYAEGGYEVLHAHRGYGEPAAFAPEAGERLVEAALQAIDKLGRPESAAP